MDCVVLLGQTVAVADSEEVDAIVVASVALGGHDGAALTEALMAHCKKTLAPYKYPRWIEFIGELPKTATGKIQRFKLRAKAQ